MESQLNDVTINNNNDGLSLTYESYNICKLRIGLAYSEGLEGEWRYVYFNEVIVQKGLSTVLIGENNGWKMQLEILKTPTKGVVMLEASVQHNLGSGIRLWNIYYLDGSGAKGEVVQFPEGSKEIRFLEYDPYYVAGIPLIKPDRTPHKENHLSKRDEVNKENCWYFSRDFGGLTAGECGMGIFAGFYGPGRAYGDIAYKYSDDDEERFMIRSRMDGILLESCEPRYGEKAMLIFSTADDASRRWAEQTALEMPPRRLYPQLSGWCSWYRLRTEVKENDIKEAVKQYMCLEKPIDFIQIDDGYQQAMGKWEANYKFPSGMKKVAQIIKEAGFMPGIWIGPTLCNQSNEELKKNPHWLQRYPDGKVAITFDFWEGGSVSLMDPTVPEVQEILRENIEKITKDWGYSYIKIDFTGCLAVGACYHNPKLTSLQIHREMFRIFREAAGDKTYILACVSSCERAALGFADAARIGWDCAPLWRKGSFSAYNMINTSIIRSVTNERWWWNDPDAVYMRDDDCELEWEERLAMMTAALINGGMTYTSDLPSQWTETAKQAFLQMLPPAGGKTSTVGLGKSGLPQILIRSIIGTNYEGVVLGSFQIDEEYDKKEIKFKDLGLEEKFCYHIFEYWTSTYLGTFFNSFVLLDQPTHSARLYRIIPDYGNLCILADSVHPLIEQEIHYTDEGKFKLSYPLEKIWKLKEVTIHIFTKKLLEIEDIMGGYLFSKNQKENDLVEIKVKREPTHLEKPLTIYLSINTTFSDIE